MGHIVHPISFRLGVTRFWNQKIIKNNRIHNEQRFAQGFESQIFKTLTFLFEPSDQVLLSHVITKKSTNRFFFNVYLYDGWWENLFYTKMAKKIFAINQIARFFFRITGKILYHRTLWDRFDSINFGSISKFWSKGNDMSQLLGLDPEEDKINKKRNKKFKAHDKYLKWLFSKNHTKYFQKNLKIPSSLEILMEKEKTKEKIINQRLLKRIELFGYFMYLGLFHGSIFLNSTVLPKIGFKISKASEHENNYYTFSGGYRPRDRCSLLAHSHNKLIQAGVATKKLRSRTPFLLRKSYLGKFPTIPFVLRLHSFISNEFYQKLYYQNEFFISKLWGGSELKKTNVKAIFNFKNLNNVNLTARVLVRYMITQLRMQFRLNTILYPLIRKVNLYMDGIKIRLAGRFTRANRAMQQTKRYGKPFTSAFSVGLNYGSDSFPLKYGKGSVRIQFSRGFHFFRNFSKEMLFYFKKFGTMKDFSPIIWAKFKPKKFFNVGFWPYKSTNLARFNGEIIKNRIRAMQQKRNYIKRYFGIGHNIGLQRPKPLSKELKKKWMNKFLRTLNKNMEEVFFIFNQFNEKITKAIVLICFLSILKNQNSSTITGFEIFQIDSINKKNFEKTEKHLLLLKTTNTHIGNSMVAIKNELALWIRFTKLLGSLKTVGLFKFWIFENYGHQPSMSWWYNLIKFIAIKENLVKLKKKIE